MPPENERLSKQILIPEAGDLMDAHGIRRDFVTAKAEVQYLLSHLANAEPKEFLLIQALSTSVIVRYCRPFAEGVRNYQIARGLVGELSSTEASYHQRILDWRNKHIAHSVNSFETNYLYAEWAEKPMTPATITKVGVAETKIIGLNSSELEAIVSITEKYIGSLDKLIAVETQRVLELAKHADSEAILMSGNIELSFPNQAAIAKPRNRK